ncbi:unnamed protein product [Parajaminaea phylloscopi]
MTQRERLGDEMRPGLSRRCGASADKASRLLRLFLHLHDPDPTAIRGSRVGMVQAAPLPGVIILATTPPLFLPSLLLSSHIRHPLKDVYPKLVAEQWSGHLARLGIEADAAAADPIVWLEGLPELTIGNLTSGHHESDDDSTDTRSDDSSAGDLGGSEDGVSSVLPSDDEDRDGNVWRGAKRVPRTMKHKRRSPPEGSVFANLTIGQVTYLAPVPSGGNPLLSLSFLSHLHAVLSEYFRVSTTSQQTMASTSSPVSIPAAVLSANFDVIYQILQEMLDDGRPLTTELSSIKGVVRGKAWWEDIMGRMASLTTSASVPPPQISPLPWRNPAVRYPRNEVYVDIVEVLSGSMDRKGKAVASEGLRLTVCIGCKARLSGSPDLTLALHPSPKTGDMTFIGPSFHPCVRHKRWHGDGVLSFIPPDGDFELARFAMGASELSPPPASKAQGARLASASPWERFLPFTLTAKRRPTEGREWSFEIRLTACSSSKMASKDRPAAEGLEICFAVCPGQLAPIGSSRRAEQGDNSALGEVSVDARAAVSSAHPLSLGSSGAVGGSSMGQSSSVALTSGDDAGTWHYDSGQGVVRWTVPHLGHSSGSGHSAPQEVSLKGKISFANKAVEAGEAGSTMYNEAATSWQGGTQQSSWGSLPRPSSIVSTFSLPVGTPSLSGLRVASLTVGGHAIDYKPFKGVRGATRGRLEWRW